jgi:Fe-S-cluster containining protein
LDENDIRRFAHGLNLPVAEFQTRYLSAADEPATFKFKALPCPFLENDLCSNYDHRPETCRSYPHLHKKDFLSRTLRVLDNYEICPIVFNVYERLNFSFG